MAPKQARKKAAKGNQAVKEYQPTAAEIGLVQRHLDRRKERHRAPGVKVVKTKGQQVQVKPCHPNHAIWQMTLQAAMGTVEQSFADMLLNQVSNVILRDPEDPDEHALNAVLAAMHGISPRDETEAMLAAQMVASHVAAMEMSRRAMRAEYLDPMNTHANLANKFMRTYALQAEALKRYRSTAQQIVRVERVYVNEGGQAIVGAVSHRGPQGGP